MCSPTSTTVPPPLKSSSTYSTCSSSSSSSMELDTTTGQPVLPPPPQPSSMRQAVRLGMMYCVLPFMVPVLLLSKVNKLIWSDLWKLWQVVLEAGRDPIKHHQEYYQDSKLLTQLYQQPSAKAYLDRNALQWQFMEGYCGPATLRCALASFSGVPSDLLPPQERGPMGPEKFVEKVQAAMLSIHQAAKEEKKKEDTNTTTTTTIAPIPKIETEIVRGDCSYDVFLQTIRRVQNDNERVVLNFLRPALFGPMRPVWIPTHAILGMFGGHFSPIIGILENSEEKDNPLVAVFDVNHKYGGAYFVPARRLHQAVQAKDVTSGESRALVVLTNKAD